MSTPARRYWSELTSLEFTRLDSERTIAVLPVGAIEQHGPHLPLAVDTCLLDGIIDRAVRRMPDELPALILPTVAVGKSNEHARYPGTLSFSFDTLSRIWMDIGASVANAGVRKLLLFNSHGGQISAMDIVSRDLRIKHNMLVVSSSWFALGLPDDSPIEQHEVEHGIHGGTIETSMMLSLAPGLVDMAQADKFTSLSEALAEQDFSLVSLNPAGKLAWQAQDLNPRGVCGDATKASAELGERLIDFASARFIALLQEIDRLPLSLLDNQPAW